MNSTQYLINGRSDITLSPLDRGFAYGDGVFRTIKITGGKPDHWALHYTKLLEDCNVLGIVCPAADLLMSDLKQLVTDRHDAVIKIIITRGEGARGYAVPALAQPTRIVIKTPLPSYPSANFDEGVKLHLCELRLSAQAKYAGIKHLNRLENVMARMEWSDSSIVDGVLLDSHENVIECTMSNLFARFGTTLLTPDLGNCGVAGITRQQILKLALNLGLSPEVAQIALSRLMQADELVICNSLYGVWQVRAFNERTWSQSSLASNLRKALHE